MSRPRKEIDWKKVEELLIAGCSGAEIAGYMGCHPTTIYEKCAQQNGISFTEYSSEFYSKGDALLKAKQYAKALGLSKDGDNTLLIWLGKCRLKQKEEQNIIPPNDEKIQQEHSLIMENKRLKDELNAIKPETNTELSRSDSTI
jgi:hypothetical protein